MGLKKQNRAVAMLLACTVALSSILCYSHGFAASAASGDIDIAGVVGQYTLGEEEMSAVIYEINKETGEVIDDEIAKQEAVNYDEGVSVEITPRVWDNYGSDAADDNFTESELVFYTRLANLAQYYMDNSTIDAYFVKSYNIYAINGVQYDDLGLTSTEAFYVAQWFLYNNPQYYFLKPTFLTTNNAVYIACHDIAVDGDDRGEITNEMFDNIDYIVSEVGKLSSNPAEREKYLHDIVCGNLVYQSNDYDQSIYSSVMLGETVCAGYAGLMNVLCNASGIDTITSLSKVHAWNEVQLDGEWYGVDATWNDSLGSYMFFDVCDENLKVHDSDLLEHTVEAAWVDWTPDLADSDYGSEGMGPDSEISLPVPDIYTETVDGDPTAFRILWKQISDASGYEVCIYGDDTYSNVLINTTTKLTSVKLTKMNDGQTYYFTVRAMCDTDGEVRYSDYAYGYYTCVVDRTQEPSYTQLEKPVDPYVYGETENSVNVAWGSAGDGYSYEVRLYRDAAYTDMLASGVTKSLSLKVTGMAPGSDVYVRIRSVYGDSYSEWCELSGRSLGQDSGSDVISYDPVSGLSVCESTDLSLKSEWAGSDGALKYEVQISRYDDFSKILASGRTSKLRMNITGLVPDTDYHIRVRAVYDNDGQEAFSEWSYVSGHTMASSTVKVDVPVNVSVSDITMDSALVSWDGSADSFEVNVKKLPGNASVFNVKLSDNKTVITDLEPGCSYSVQVRAFDGSISSEWSVNSDFETEIDKSVDVDVPANVYVSDITAGSLKLNWDMADDALYEVQISRYGDFSKILASGKTAKQRMNITGLLPDMEYHIRVRSVVSIDGNTCQSDWVTVSQKTAPVVQAVNMPVNPYVENVNAGASRIRWTKVSDSASCEIIIYKDAAHTQKLAGIVSSKESLKISGLSSGTRYYVMLRTVIDVSGTTQYSDWTELDFVQ